MVRLKDIAEACGVSVASVSRALNGLMKEDQERTILICRTAREMGYYPNAAAKALKTSHSSNIGVLYEDQLNHEYFSSLLNELRREAAARGYDLTLINSENGGEGGYYDHVRRRNLDGVIVIQADFESAEVIRLATGSVPSVIIDHLYEGCDCVGNDNRASMEQIVRYAWGKGHREFAYICGEQGAVTGDRLAGFYKACTELGIRVPEGRVREGHFHEPAVCAEMIREILDQNSEVTCILCPDDYSCLGAIVELVSEGISVPERISLIGYDGIRMGRMVKPQLTTYSQDIRVIARETIALLLEAIETPEDHQPRKILVPGRLIEGETVRELSR